MLPVSQSVSGRVSSQKEGHSNECVSSWNEGFFLAGCGFTEILKLCVERERERREEKMAS